MEESFDELLRRLGGRDDAEGFVIAERSTRRVLKSSWPTRGDEAAASLCALAGELLRAVEAAGALAAATVAFLGADAGTASGGGAPAAGAATAGDASAAAPMELLRVMVHGRDWVVCPLGDYVLGVLQRPRPLRAE